MKAKQFESPGGVTDTKKGAFRGSKEAVGKPDRDSSTSSQVLPHFGKY